MENQAQTLFPLAFAKLVLAKYITDSVLQSCIAPQFEIPVLLVAMNTVLTKLRMSAWLSSSNGKSQNIPVRGLLGFWPARSNRWLWFCLIMRLISNNKIHLLTCAAFIARVCHQLVYAYLLLPWVSPGLVLLNTRERRECAELPCQAVVLPNTPMLGPSFRLFFKCL